MLFNASESSVLSICFSHTPTSTLWPLATADTNNCAVHRWGEAFRFLSPPLPSPSCCLLSISFEEYYQEPSTAESSKYLLTVGNSVSLALSYNVVHRPTTKKSEKYFHRLAFVSFSEAMFCSIFLLFFFLFDVRGLNDWNTKKNNSAWIVQRYFQWIYCHSKGICVEYVVLPKNRFPNISYAKHVSLTFFFYLLFGLVHLLWDTICFCDACLYALIGQYSSRLLLWICVGITNVTHTNTHTRHAHTYGRICKTQSFSIFYFVASFSPVFCRAQIEFVVGKLNKIDSRTKSRLSIVEWQYTCAAVAAHPYASDVGVCCSSRRRCVRCEVMLHVLSIYFFCDWLIRFGFERFPNNHR